MSTIGPAELSKLLDEHGARLVLYAQQWCRTPEDVVQEALVQLTTQQPVPTNVVGWLYRVVRNKAISGSRAESTRRRHEKLVPVQPWFVARPDEQLDADAVTEALTGLDIEQREVIVLRLWGGLTFEDIAELTGKSASSAHRHYEASMAALRKKLRIRCLDQGIRMP